jgi:[acyl-carrier-protein] S-malonyltransferase
MQEAVPPGVGAMAAILGLELDVLTQVCDEAAAAHGTCACANLNAPGQIVIAGTAAAIDRACELAAARGAKRAIRLPVSVPAHCALMRPAAARLAARLAPLAVHAPALSVIHNVDVAVHSDAAAIKNALVQQLYSPVRWIETMERFAAGGYTLVCECGPGKVLSALIKRIDRAITSMPLVDTAEIRRSIITLREVAV